MPRPLSPRRLRFDPEVKYYKPRGVPLRELSEVIIKADEVEALKLHDVDGLDHVLAAKEMDISQPTFSRILNRAYQKLASAVISGKAIRLEPRLKK